MSRQESTPGSRIVSPFHDNLQQGFVWFTWAENSCFGISLGIPEMITNASEILGLIEINISEFGEGFAFYGNQ